MLMILLIIPVFLQVSSRLIYFIPRYIWTEEIARFAFVWIIMVGATIAVKEETHFRVDLFPNLSPRKNVYMQWILLVLLLFFAIIFTIGGFNFAKFGAPQRSEIASLPMLSIYIAWPLAGLSWISFLTERMYDFYANAQKPIE